MASEQNDISQERNGQSDVHSAPNRPTEQSDQEDVFSVFSKTEKRTIALLVAYAGSFSPLSSFIYYPAINVLARDLHTTVELVNLTITSYMVVSGVMPSLLSDIADTFGRRPIYIAAFVTYLAANIGLAVQRSYYALLLLRMLQSAGSSGRGVYTVFVLTSITRYRRHLPSICSGLGHYNTC
jgi:MFS family permease